MSQLETAKLDFDSERRRHEKEIRKVKEELEESKEKLKAIDKLKARALRRPSAAVRSARLHMCAPPQPRGDTSESLSLRSEYQRCNPPMQRCSRQQLDRCNTLALRFAMHRSASCNSCHVARSCGWLRRRWRVRSPA